MKFTISLIFITCLFLSGCSNEIGDGAFIDHGKSLIENNEKICIIGDSGTGTDSQYAVAAGMEKVNCTQVRLIGDIIYPSGLNSIDDPLLQSNFYAPYKSLLKTTPFYLLQGNHDYKQGFFALWIDIAKKDTQLIYPSHYYAERWNDICFFSLDTTFYDKLYHVFKRAPQTNWLHSMMTKMNDCQYSVVFGHHPYVSSGEHGDAVLQLATFLNSEILGTFDMYFAGHDHSISDEGAIRDTRLLISGSAGKIYDAGTDTEDKRFFASKLGFITLQFSRDSNQRIIAHHAIYSVDPEDNDPTPVMEWQDSTTGKGIR